MKKKSAVRQMGDNVTYWLYSPIREYEWASERRKIQSEAKPSSLGRWEASVGVDGNLVPLKLRIDASSIVFDEAARWPELDGRIFPLRVGEGEGILSFNTDLGEVHIQTPAALLFDGGSPDVMYLRTFRFRGWSENDLKLTRVKDES